MHNYDNLDKINEREQTLEISLQLGEYKGTLISPPIVGKVFGLDIITSIDEDLIYYIDQYEQKNCSIKLLGEDEDSDSWYRITLTDDNDGETQLEDLCRNFKDLIVGINIKNCEVKR